MGMEDVDCSSQYQLMTTFNLHDILTDVDLPNWLQAGLAIDRHAVNCSQRLTAVSLKSWQLSTAAA